MRQKAKPAAQARPASHDQQGLDDSTAREDFIGLVSHQLRTPATAVKQFLGLILQGYLGAVPDTQREVLQKAYDSNERQLNLINELLLVAKVDAGKVELERHSQDLVPLITDISNEQQASIANRQQSITVELPTTLTATVDTRFLRMVLDNLLNNASKYSPDGSVITISAYKYDDHIYISVADKGVGISKKDQSRLGVKFSRIANERSALVEGTGLGLYWSNKIIQLHGGELSVKSRPRQGSTFTISLPVT